MIFVYNFLQIILLVMTLPLLAMIVLCRKKYRSQLAQRLGFRLPVIRKRINTAEKKVIWIHALSVGEVTSALPLAWGIRQEINDVIIVFSVATKTGRHTADKLISPFVDFVVAAPYDFLFTVNRFIRTIRPDLFILVETDFWPNWLYRLHRHKIPLMLVNGRISRKSFETYRKYSFFFTRIFRLFSLLSMQTVHDAEEMSRLGVQVEKIATLGNLKYDTALMLDGTKKAFRKEELFLPDDSVIWLCGSTHRGEEEILFKVFAGLRKSYPKLVLIIAPRNPGRGSEICDLAETMHLTTSRRTLPGRQDEPIFILDTIGELTRCYKMARLAFIGGSLVPCGGHNPLEASVHGVPVLFGPHMDDFQEIAHECIQSSAGIEVHSVTELSRTVNTLLADDQAHAAMSRAAILLVEERSGVVARHLVQVREIIYAAGPDPQE